MKEPLNVFCRELSAPREGIPEKPSEVKAKLNVEMLRVADLKVSPHIVDMPIAEDDRERLKAGMAKDGIQVPLVIDGNGDVVCGSNRLRIAGELNIETVPCIRVPITDARAIRSYSRDDNLNRRQLTMEEKKAWVMEMLEERGPVKPGRPKGGETRKTNEQIAKETGVSEKTVDRLEKNRVKVPIYEKPKGYKDLQKTSSLPAKLQRADSWAKSATRMHEEHHSAIQEASDSEAVDHDLAARLKTHFETLRNKIDESLDILDGMTRKE